MSRGGLVAQATLLVLALLIFGFGAPLSAGDDAEGRNRLAAEKSPYLLQHAQNPVWWWTWTAEALQAAKRQGKPIFLSVGYSTCHWCHVMEKESFAQADVASVLNESFVAIQVDREERPDIDSIYMQAVTAMTGGGGWPMTLLLTPDGRPFFAATYLSHDKLVQLLKGAAVDWRRDPRRAEAKGAELSQALARAAQKEAAGGLSEALLGSFLSAFDRGFDSENGGMAGAPKFPPGSSLRLLLRIHRRTGAKRALEMVTRTLDAMDQGAIHDQLGGGFHRYSTDERWLVPHFEKTLYDQAVLSSAYLEAFLVTRSEGYAQVSRETLDYVLKDMTSPAGGFFSAEDADSEGEEGKFYLWREEELRGILSPPEFLAVKAAFGIVAKGPFPGGANALHRARGKDPSDKAAFASALEVLGQWRAARVRPQRDDKVLADWNGLMIAALAEAGRVLEEPRFVAAAEAGARFVLGHLTAENGELLHRASFGGARYPGSLEDYAFMIDGLLELYEADFDATWLERAAALQRHVDARFQSPAGNYFATDGSDPSLLFREVTTEDGAVPSGNSVEALNLLRLGDLLVDPGLGNRARAILKATPKDVEKTPEAYPVALAALDYATDRSKEVAIVGDPAAPATKALLAAVRGGFNPNLVVALGVEGGDSVPLLKGRPQKGGQPTAYVCEGQVCQAPTTDPVRAAELARAMRPLKP